jgi:transposase-like protein
VDYPRAGAHYPRSTGEFLAWFGTDEDCLDYLEWLRWPGGFACPYCGNAGGWRLADGRVECGDCSRRTSVTAGTIFDKTRTPLTVWFHACWLFATAKDGISAQYLQRALEIGSYQTAWAMLHRLRSALVRPGRGRLAGTVEVDETFIGGEEHGLRGGRQPGKKVLTGIAVEIGEPKGIGRCRMAVLADASGASLGPFVAGSVEPGSRVITDGWVGYNGLAALGYAHERRNQKAAARRGQDPGELLPAVHRVASLCKRWLLGTHQGRVEPAHLQAYLNEFAFRFNRRHSRSRGMVFYRVLELAAGHDPVRYDDIRATRKPRSKPPQQRGTGHPPSLDRPAAARPWRTAEMQLQFPLRLSGYPGNGYQPLQHRPHQLVWCGCHTHAATATWLGHPRLIKSGGQATGHTSRATAGRQERSNTTRLGPGHARCPAKPTRAGRQRLSRPYPAGPARRRGQPPCCRPVCRTSSRARWSAAGNAASPGRARPAPG